MNASSSKSQRNSVKIYNNPYVSDQGGLDAFSLAEGSIFSAENEDQFSSVYAANRSHNVVRNPADRSHFNSPPQYARPRPHTSALDTQSFASSHRSNNSNNRSVKTTNTNNLSRFPNSNQQSQLYAGSGLDAGPSVASLMTEILNRPLSQVSGPPISSSNVRVFGDIIPANSAASGGYGGVNGGGSMVSNNGSLALSPAQIMSQLNVSQRDPRQQFLAQQQQQQLSPNSQIRMSQSAPSGQQIGMHSPSNLQPVNNRWNDNMNHSLVSVLEGFEDEHEAHQMSQYSAARQDYIQHRSGVSTGSPNQSRGSRYMTESKQGEMFDSQQYGNPNYDSNTVTTFQSIGNNTQYTQNSPSKQRSNAKRSSNASRRKNKHRVTSANHPRSNQDEESSEVSSIQTRELPPVKFEYRKYSGRMRRRNTNNSGGSSINSGAMYSQSEQYTPEQIQQMSGQQLFAPQDVAHHTEGPGPGGNARRAREQFPSTSLQLLQVGIDTALPVLDILDGNRQLDDKLGFTQSQADAQSQQSGGRHGSSQAQRRKAAPIVIENETKVGPGGILYSVNNTGTGGSGVQSGGNVGANSLFPMFQY